jgi:hypothetical protein
MVTILDTAGILSDEQDGEVLDGTHHTFGLPLKRGFTPSIESRLVRLNLHQYPVAHARVDHHGLDRGNFHLRFTLRRVKSMAAHVLSMAQIL